MRQIRSALREYRTWTTDSRRWRDYEPRPGDIIIATSPKCGTTWMQQIVSSLIFQDPTPRSLATVSPWIDGRATGSAEEVHNILRGQTHRRFPKSHLPIDGLPLYDEVKYIHVARDGRDACMSMHNQYMAFSAAQIDRFDRIGLDDPVLGRPFPPIPKSPAEYFRLWISTAAVAGQTEGIPAPSYFDLEAGYWAERRRANFLLVHYQDLLDDLDLEMRRIAAFLAIDVDEATWPSLVGAAGFVTMRTVADVLVPHVATSFSEGAQRFFYRGTNGRWRGVLADDDLHLYLAKTRTKFTPQLAAWLERGRHASGEPSEIADEVSKAPLPPPASYGPRMNALSSADGIDVST